MGKDAVVVGPKRNKKKERKEGRREEWRGGRTEVGQRESESDRDRGRDGRGRQAEIDRLREDGRLYLKVFSLGQRNVHFLFANGSNNIVKI